MKFRELLQAWNDFWFTPQSASVMGLFRILYGLHVIEYCVLIAPDLLTWFGARGVLSQQTAWNIMGLPCINLIGYWNLSDPQIQVFFGVFFIAAVCLTLGLFTRTSALLVYLGLVSFHHRNTFIINGGDVLLKLCAFYLIISAAGAAFSIDRLIRKCREGNQQQPVLASIWPQRLLQIQIALIYMHAFFSKLDGATWLNGTAVYYTMKQVEFTRFSIPFVSDSLPLSRMLSWGTLLVEFAMWALVWFKQLRYPILLATLGFHLGLELTMNLPIFETLMMACLVVFIFPEDLDRWITQIKAKRLRPNIVQEPT